MHTHLDAQITWDPLGSPSNLHGVTSVVVGNCGVGFAPCKPKDRDYLMFLMEGVEDIPQAAMRAGLRWNWETFPEYLDALAAQPLGLNVGAHLSHAPLRVYAMGERGATDALAERRRAGVHARGGARGAARRRARLRHRPHDDAPHAGVGPGAGHVRRPPRARRARRRAGRGRHRRVRARPVRRAPAKTPAASGKEFDWMTPLARDINRPFSLGLVQNLGYPDAWRDVAARWPKRAAARGARIVPQVGGARGRRS